MLLFPTTKLRLAPVVVTIVLTAVLRVSCGFRVVQAPWSPPPVSRIATQDAARNGNLPRRRQETIRFASTSVERHDEDVVVNSSEDAMADYGYFGLNGLRPAEPLDSLAVGESLEVTIRLLLLPDEEEQVRTRNVTRVAMDPPMYVIRNVMSVAECDSVRHDAQYQTEEGMREARTRSAGDTASRTNCRVGWLDTGDATTMQGQLARSLGRLFLSPSVWRHARSSVEDLQVVHYQSGGQFVLHHDGQPRVLTILYYLNGVAGTWFPLADHHPVSAAAAAEPPLNRRDALKQCENLQPGKDGLVVLGPRDKLKKMAKTNNSAPLLATDLPSSTNTIPITSGDAIVFFNYDCGSTADGRVNWKAIHAGLPVNVQDDDDDHENRLPSSERKCNDKWIANNWYRYGVFESQTSNMLPSYSCQEGKHSLAAMP
jgi:hypothetical protein